MLEAALGRTVVKTFTPEMEGHAPPDTPEIPQHQLPRDSFPIVQIVFPAWGPLPLLSGEGNNHLAPDLPTHTPSPQHLLLFQGSAQSLRLVSPCHGPEWSGKVRVTSHLHGLPPHSFPHQPIETTYVQDSHFLPREAEEPLPAPCPFPAKSRVSLRPNSQSSTGLRSVPRVRLLACCNRGTRKKTTTITPGAKGG